MKGKLLGKAFFYARPGIAFDTLNVRRKRSGRSRMFVFFPLRAFVALFSEADKLRLRRGEFLRMRIRFGEVSLDKRVRPGSFTR